MEGPIEENAHCESRLLLGRMGKEMPNQLVVVSYKVRDRAA